jgi:hypothetical protein
VSCCMLTHLQGLELSKTVAQCFVQWRPDTVEALNI